MTYLVYQLEVCPKTQKLHVQGYVEFINGMSYKAIKKLFNDDTMHLESRAGSADQAANYCTKVESRFCPDGEVDSSLLPYVQGPLEFGQRSKQGSRTDLTSAISVLVESGSIRQVAAEFPEIVVKYSRGLDRLLTELQPPSFRALPSMEYHYGEPRTGKSRYCYNLHPDAYRVLDSPQGWFDGYRGQTVVIFEDFQGLFPLGLMLQLLDPYPLQLPVKGGFVSIRATKFLFNSNAHYDNFYRHSHSYMAWCSRFEDVNRCRVQYYPGTSVQ